MRKAKFTASNSIKQSPEIMLEEAVDTLKRLPNQRIKAKLTSWPEIVQKSAEHYASTPNFIKPAAPEPSAIDRLDFVLDALVTVNDVERRLLWARASKISWRKLEQYENLSHTTLRKFYKTGLDKLSHKLNIN